LLPKMNISQCSIYLALVGSILCNKDLRDFT
jgi:hypothetical protein